MKDQRLEKLIQIASNCALCPRCCGVDRAGGELGFCGIGMEARVCSWGPHWGEESVLLGEGGSGTIFFAGCNLECVFCQNYEISRISRGHRLSWGELASVMLKLEKRGCANVNLVSPSHQLPVIYEAIKTARHEGLEVPVVYNSGGYDSVEALQCFEGLVDIYMPDLKYADADVGRELSGVPDYPEKAKSAIKEMHRQVGDLIVRDGVAVRGLIVRHLVLPGGLAGTAECMRFIAEEVSKDTYVNIMDQYYPEYRACAREDLNRRITRAEYQQAVEIARSYGLWNFAD
ncbi:MAG: radical SAM protein [Bacillota bacterium]